MKYYHATDMENEESIIEHGLEPGVDGVVYLSDSPENALKFVVIRGYEKVLVVEVDKDSLEPEKLSESHDHAEWFFQCKAWQYKGSIDPGLITDFICYEKSKK